MRLPYSTPEPCYGTDRAPPIIVIYGILRIMMATVPPVLVPRGAVTLEVLEIAA